MHSQKKTIWGHAEKEVICKPRRAQVSEESKPASILVLDIQPPGLWENKILLFKPPSLWYAVTATLAN